ncbi:MAG: UvrB/UvrC motif-containing protein [Planctomycetota bacterium]|nr:UvrB/UvrC motif-containing protein [Planctomycetota bacterium]
MLLDHFEHCLEPGPNGLLNVRALPTHGGVYLIVDRERRPVLLAHGENLRRVVVNRLAAPAPDQKSRRTNLSEIAGSVYWRGTFSRFETALVHWRIVRLHDPRGYRESIGFGPSWFLRVRSEEQLPRFTAVRELRDDGARYAGPFQSRRGADAWVQMLEDIFDLCRYYDILEQVPNGQPCAYYEMGKCPAPCDGSIPMSAYADMIANAWAFTVGDREPGLSRLSALMQSAAGRLEFEKAAALRQSIERAESLFKRPDNKYIGDVSTCRWLIVQRGGPARRTHEHTLIKPFVVHCGAIVEGEPISLAQADSVVPRWIEDYGEQPVPAVNTRDEQIARSELLWLVGKFLFQEDRAPGLFLRFDRLPDVDELVADIRRRFGSASLPESDEAETQPN